MEKASLRNKYRELRKQLSSEELDAMSLEIANQALLLDIWDKEYYHIFLPIDRLREINTEYLLSILGGKDKHVLLSKSDFSKRTMTNYLLTDSTKIVVSEQGIPEPEVGIEIDFTKIDVVFVPLLAYDTKGNRIGYGKGFYDQFLSQCREDVVKVGLSLFSPEQDIITINHQDVPLTCCITAKKVYHF